jgi:predicted Zn-dependent peptidase
MLLHSKFDPAEIDKERGVILEEMAMYLDAPMYQISWDFEQLVFGDQPLGRDQIGTKELINSVTQEQFQKYQQDLYVPENTVITIAGAVGEKDLDLLEDYFQFESRPKSRPPYPFESGKSTEKFKIRTKKTEQYHISLGVRALAEDDARFPALKVLATVLGGNMSARMFQNVREQKGLAYSIRTQVDEFTDTGLMTTRAGVKLDDVLKAVKAIRYEYDQVRDHGITEDELEMAKNYLAGKTDLSTEDTEEVAHHFGKNVLLYKNEDNFEDLKVQIRAVKKSEVDALAAELLAPENLRFAGIGPSVDEAKLISLIA